MKARRYTRGRRRPEVPFDTPSRDQASPGGDAPEDSGPRWTLALLKADANGRVSAEDVRRFMEELGFPQDKEQEQTSGPSGPVEGDQQ